MDEENLENRELIRWLKGEMNQAEKSKFESEENLDDLKFVLEDVSKWSLPEIQLEQGLQDLHQKKDSTEKTKVIPLFRVLQYAAGLLLPFAIYFGYDQFSSKTVHVLADGTEQFSYYLPDSSLVVLNPKSSISYNSRSYDKHRQLELDGEAYFEVVEGNTFQVQSVSGQIEVLGTKFQVKDFPHLFRVNCFDGRVRVRVQDDQAVLLASQGIEFRKGDEHFSEIKLVNYHWEKGYFSYSAIPLPDIIEDLNSHYNLAMDLPAKYQKLKFSGKISMMNIHESLESLFSIMQIPYSIDSDNAVTFP